MPIIERERESKKGFTLIELLVVIAIIAVLSVIGITVFSNVQKNARDARRRGDINSIVNAMEVNKTASGYNAIQNTWFASGAIPYDPLETSVTDISNTSCGTVSTTQCYYCRQNQDITPEYCNTAADGNLSDLGAVADDKDAWMICANLEKSPWFYCKRSAQ